jgi:hypothetical protein
MLRASVVLRIRQIEEIPATSLSFSEMGQPEVRDLCLADARVMVIRDRNHRSIPIWSAADEPFPIGNSRFIRLIYSEMKRLDPTRLVAYARVTLDLAARGPGADLLLLDPYWGWYMGSVKDLGPFLEMTHLLFPGKPVVLGEFGAGAIPGLRSVSWEPGLSPQFTEDYEAYLLTETWRISRSKDFVNGGMIWVWADFLSPTRKHLRSSEIPERERVPNPLPYHNMKGLVTEDRSPKNAYLVVMGMLGDMGVGNLFVWVTDQRRVPAAGAAIHLFLEDWTRIGHELTDADGKTVLWYVPQNTYRIHASAGGSEGEVVATVSGNTEVLVQLGL